MVAVIIMASLAVIASPLAVFFFYTLLDRFKRWFKRTTDRAKRDMRLRNDLYSCIYFIKDMGPNVSAYSVVAIVIQTPDTWWQLLIVFVMGMAMKRMARRLAENLAKMLGENRKRR